MPVDASLTPRQLRTIADRVEALTKARVDNTAMGVPTTPDQFECRFPSGHRGTVTWTEAPLSSATARARNGGRPVHRYVVELHAPDPDNPGEAAQEIAIRLPLNENAARAVVANMARTEANRRHARSNAGG